MVSLIGSEACGKTTLATDLANSLEKQGSSSIAVSALPSAPLSTARILTTFEAAFSHHRLDNELEILTNPRIGVEDRLGFLVAVMNRRFAFTLVLDGLESALEPKSQRFFEPGFAAFFAYLKEQLNGMSRVIITSRLSPVVGAPAPSPATFREEQIAPLREPGYPNPDHESARLLDGLDATHQQSLSQCSLFSVPMPAAALGAAMAKPPSASMDFLEKERQAGRVFAVSHKNTEYFALHPTIQKMVRTRDRNITESAIFSQASTAAANFLSEWLEKKANTASIPSWLDLSLSCVGLHLQANRYEAALEMAEKINDHLVQHGFFWEQERLNRSLLVVRAHPRPLYLIATSLMHQDRRSEARQMLEQILAMNNHHFPRETASAWFDLATLDTLDNHMDAAWDKLDKALHVNIRIKDIAGEAGCRAQMGFLEVRRNRENEALAHLESALNLYRKVDNQLGLLRLLPWTGDLYFRQGTYDQARSHFQEVLPLLQSTDNEVIECQIHHQLATIDLNQGQHEQALEGFRNSLNIKRKIDDRKGEASTFFQLGRLAKEKNDQMGCLQLLGLCQRIDEKIGDEDAQQELTLFNEIATATGLEKEQADTILQEVWNAYEQDRGETLLASIFPKHGAKPITQKMAENNR